MSKCSFNSTIICQVLLLCAWVSLYVFLFNSHSLTAQSHAFDCVFLWVCFCVCDYVHACVCVYVNLCVCLCASAQTIPYMFLQQPLLSRPVSVSLSLQQQKSENEKHVYSQIGPLLLKLSRPLPHVPQPFMDVFLRWLTARLAALRKNTNNTYKSCHETCHSQLNGQ